MEAVGVEAVLLGRIGKKVEVFARPKQLDSDPFAGIVHFNEAIGPIAINVFGIPAAFRLAEVDLESVCFFVVFGPHK